MLSAAGNEVVAPADSTPGRVSSFATGERRSFCGISGSGELRFRQTDAESERVRRIGADVRALQILEAPHHQARANEQNKRERDFRDDESVAHALTLGTAARATAFLEHIDQPRTRNLQRGHQTENDTRDNSYSEREREDAPVEIKVDPIRNFVRQGAQHQIDAPDGEDQTERAAGHADNDAFGEKLTHDLRPGRANRQANARLPCSRVARRARRRLATFAQAMR